MNHTRLIAAAFALTLATIAPASGQVIEEGVGATQREDLATALLECSLLAEQGDAVEPSMAEII
jgi:hypothetical protein